MSEPLSKKTLKIGLVQDGRLVSESTLVDRDEVTIGSDPGNTISVSGGGVPRTHKLLSRTPRGFELRPLRGLAGKVMTSSGAVDIAERAQGPALSLGDTGKGKITIGNATILFQVVPMPAPAYTKLPKEFRGGYATGMDRGFVVMLAISIVMHFVAVTYLNAMPVPETLMEDRTAEFVNAILNQDIIVPPEVPVEEAKPEEAKATEKLGGGGGPKKEKGSGGEPEPVNTDVGAKGLLAIITSATEGGSVADLIGSSGSDNGIGDIMSKVSGGVNVARAGGGGTKGGDGGLGPSAVGPGQLGTAGNPRGVDTGEKKEATVKAAMNTSEGNIGGNLDAQTVRGYIMKRIGGVRSCYEQQLKIDPSLSGKVSVTFSIGGDGSVGSCSVTTSTIANSEVGDCVCRRISGWHFTLTDAEQSGNVSYSFIFTPAN